MQWGWKKLLKRITEITFLKNVLLNNLILLVAPTHRQDPQLCQARQPAPASAPGPAQVQFLPQAPRWPCC